MINKRKKNIRMRGSKTHGYGSMKKHRGAGSRGGRGMAGTGKRADVKKPSISQIKNYFGKYGFTTKRRNFVTSVNVNYLELNCEALLKKGIFVKNKEFIVVDLNKLGIDKLIAKGKATRKYDITCNFATDGAIKAIEVAKGKITLLNNKNSEEKSE
jgi:large subunit ribosomal protein L15